MYFVFIDNSSTLLVSRYYSYVITLKKPFWNNFKRIVTINIVIKSCQPQWVFLLFYCLFWQPFALSNQGNCLFWSCTSQERGCQYVWTKCLRLRSGKSETSGGCLALTLPFTQCFFWTFNMSWNFDLFRPWLSKTKDTSKETQVEILCI